MAPPNKENNKSDYMQMQAPSPLVTHVHIAWLEGPVDSTQNTLHKSTTEKKLDTDGGSTNSTK